MNNTANQLDETNPENWPYIMNLTHIMKLSGMGKNKTLDVLQS